jgi:uncharacterized protein YjbI with pentapeptide repeats
MAGANFADVKYIQGTNFTGANLSSAILTGINMSGSNFTQANLAGAQTTSSGVATPAKPKVTTTGSHGLGRFTVTCSGAVSTAGTRQAQPQQITYTVIR